jgi:hypothetical protein
MVETRRAALPPVWARDPFGRFPHRLFDGSAWTDRVARGGRTFRDSFLMGSPTPPPELPTTCDECGFDVGDAKFCPRCGTPAAPLARPPYCYQCGSNPPPGAAFCDECGSRLDALAPGLNVRDAEEWQRVFRAIGWFKEPYNAEKASRDTQKKLSRLGWNLHAQLREWELPAFAGEDPSEPWVMWLSVGDQRRSAWLPAEEAAVNAVDDEGSGAVDTLIITRCRLMALSPGRIGGSRPTLVFQDSLANLTDANTTPTVTRLAFGGAGRALEIEWKPPTRPSPLTPADMRVLNAGNPGNDASIAPPPMRRASDRRDSGRFLAEALLASFGRQVRSISNA